MTITNWFTFAVFGSAPNMSIATNSGAHLLRKSWDVLDVGKSSLGSSRMIGTGGPILKIRWRYATNNSSAAMCRTFVETRGLRRVAGNVTTTVSFDVNRLAPLFAVIYLFSTCLLEILVCRTYIPTWECWLLRRFGGMACHFSERRWTLPLNFLYFSLHCRLSSSSAHGWGVQEFSLPIRSPCKGCSILSDYLQEESLSVCFWATVEVFRRQYLSRRLHLWLVETMRHRCGAWPQFCVLHRILVRKLVISIFPAYR